MILTCPECATRYFVADDKVGADGRNVRCSACGNRWTAHGEADLDLFVDPEDGAGARELKPDEIPVSALPGDELPKVFRQKATTERRVREAATTGVIWAGMAVALVAVAGGAAVFRGSVVDVWPAAASAYAAVGMPVNRIGLEIEDVRAEAALQDSQAALAVSGLMRNVEDRPVKAPPLRIELKNKAGKVVFLKIAAPADPLIPPGETRHFAVALLDPPNTAATLEVSFELAKGAKGEHEPDHPGDAPESRKLALRGSMAVVPVPPAASEEAAPLPESSPYALPETPK